MNYSIPKQNEEGYCVRAYTRHPDDDGYTYDSPGRFLWFSVEHTTTTSKSSTIFHFIWPTVDKLNQKKNKKQNYVLTPPPPSIIRSTYTYQTSVTRHMQIKTTSSTPTDFFKKESATMTQYS
jgi:hypothetical protein